MLGLAPGLSGISPGGLRAGLAGALADFHHCRYARLAETLPRLISAGHLLAADDDAAGTSAVLAGTYTLAARMLIKLDDQRLGWMAADRAQAIAVGSGDPLISAEAARNLAVLARKAGWHAQATSIALRRRQPRAAWRRSPAGGRTRPAHPVRCLHRRPRGRSRRHARADRPGSCNRRASGGAVILRDHGCGFTPATVGLHRISAENHAGDPPAAVAAAARVAPASLPTTERRARYWTDTARAYSMWGKREDCIQALLAAEHSAPRRSMPGPPSAT